MTDKEKKRVEDDEEQQTSGKPIIKPEGETIGPPQEPPPDPPGQGG